MNRMTIGLLIALLVAGCYGSFLQLHGFNQLSRIDMLYAMAHEGRLEIDTLHKNTRDVAEFGGHYYSDKPPALTYLAIPAYSFTLALQRAIGMDPASDAGIAVSLWTTTLSTVVLLSALGALATWTLLAHVCRKPRHALAATIGIWLGTLAWPYGTMLFPHAATIALTAIAMAAVLLPVPAAVKKHAPAQLWWQPAGGLGMASVIALCSWTVLRLAGTAPSVRLLTLFIGMLAISGLTAFAAGTWNMASGQGGAAERRRRDALAGLAMGTAVLGEYLAVFPAAVLWLELVRRDRSRALRMALWAAVPMLLLPLTNWLCFGSPFRLGYGMNDFQWMETGFFGITMVPRFEYMLAVLFSASKGLFFWSPFLVLCIPGFFELWRRDRVLCLLLALGCLAVLTAVASSGNPGGGAAVGPRYLAPLIPLLALPAALGFGSLPRFGGVLAAVSVAVNGLAAAVDPMPPETLLFPLTEHHLPRLAQGDLLPTVWSLLGLPNFAAILPLICFAAALITVLWTTAGAMRANRTVDA